MERKMNDTTTDGKTGTVKITRNFNLPLEEVWKAWSEPASFKKWWDRKSMIAQVVKLISSQEERSLRIWFRKKAKRFGQYAKSQKLIR